MLLDFGSARQSLMDRTQSLTVFISPGYAPIEQYSRRGEKQGPWTDIYGLGATIFRTVTGRAPSDAADRSIAIIEYNKDTIPKLAEVGLVSYSTQFLEAVDWALEFKAKDRPQSIAQWREMLDPPMG